MRLDALPPGYQSNDLQHDVVAIINLGAQDLNAPEFGTFTPDQSIPLQARGTTNNPAFGGGGPVVIESLVAGEVWITLVSESASHFTLRGSGMSASVPALSDGQALYLVPACAADITGDGFVDVNDLLMVIGNWGATGPNPADITGDGVVNVADLLGVIGTWGTCP